MPKTKPTHTPGQVRMAQDLAVSFGHHKNASLHLTALYAAAPDLLEAATAVRDLLLSGEETCPICDRPQYLDCIGDEACGRLRAVIAKAEGK